MNIESALRKNACKTSGRRLGSRRFLIAAAIIILTSGVLILQTSAWGLVSVSNGDEPSTDPSPARVGWPATSSGAEDDVGRTSDAVIQMAAAMAHQQLFIDDRFPSAQTCRECHPDHYDEWSVSQHAYAQVSPVLNAMAATIAVRTNGTNGDFCIRCHTPVGMSLGEPAFMTNMDRRPTSREGVTCIVCHRVNKSYGKVSGRLAIVEGDIFQPVYGPSGNEELRRVLADPEKHRVVTDHERPNYRSIHVDAIKFFQLPTSAFCGTCHDVTLVNGFRLEEAFSEYKDSPAAKRGVSCQDCHMGIEPGVPSGYRQGSAVTMPNVETKERKLTNHRFAGPDYSVLHPGLFPFNPEAEEMATMREWLEFNWKAGWGTDDFEDDVSDEFVFPEQWDDIEDRYDAREIIEDNLELLATVKEERLKLLRVGYVLGDPVTEECSERGIRFKIEVSNGTDGHGVPTGFDAERLVWLQVTVTDRNGNVVMQSGDLDPDGDVRDLHSLYVHDGELPLDKQLFSLQSKFVTRNVRGGEREQVIPVNYSLDPLPYVRPETRSSVLLGRPGGARKHKQNIEPLGSRWAAYTVKPSQLTGHGPYSAVIELKAAMVPINLIHEIKDVGFDYFMSPREVADGVLAGHLVLWERKIVFRLHE